jgi:RNA polymerase sigma factor (sigma-70 family)
LAAKCDPRGAASHRFGLPIPVTLAARKALTLMMAAQSIAMSMAGSGVEDPDLPLVSRARRGDQVAFEELYYRYQQPITRLVANMVRQPEVVPDLVQEIFAKVYFALEGFSPGMPFRPWLYRVAGNHTIDFLRKRRRTPEEVSTTTEDDAEWVLPDRRAVDARQRVIARDLADKLLRTLKPRDRMLLVLKEMDELSLEEIGSITGMGISAVKVALFRARRRLFDRYQKWERGGSS